MFDSVRRIPAVTMKKWRTILYNTRMSFHGHHLFELVSLPRSVSTGPRQRAGWLQFNHDLHLVHTLSGTGALRVDDMVYPTSPDCVIAVPIRQTCLWDKTTEADWTMINVHYRITLSGDVPIEHLYAIPIVFRPEGLRAIHRNLRRWHRRLIDADALAQTQVAVEVHALVARYWSDHARAVEDHPPIDRAVQNVQRRIEQQGVEAFDAASLASSADLSVSQMNRRFRAAIGHSPKAYWQQQRAALCRKALRDRDDTIERLAYDLGFNDAYYFSRWFRQNVGMTPGQYRRRSRLMSI